MKARYIYNGRILPIICTITVFFNAWLSYSDDKPLLLHYQGRLVVEGRNFDGQGFIKFSLIAGSSLAEEQVLWHCDGTPVYSPEPSSGIPLEVSHGLFNVMLGDTNLMERITSELFVGNDDVFLRIWFKSEADAEYELLEPDSRIGTVAFAAVSEIAKDVPDKVITSEKISAGAINAQHISDNAITSSKIASSSITADSLADGIISNEKLAADFQLDASRIIGESGAAAALGTPVILNAFNWIQECEVTLIEGPSVNIERLTGFDGSGNSVFTIGESREGPIVFECGIEYTNALAEWLTSDSSHTYSFKFSEFAPGLAEYWWNIDYFSLASVNRIEDDRLSCALESSRRIPLHAGIWCSAEVFSEEAFGSEDVRNLNTDVRVEVEGVSAGRYPEVQVDHKGKTLSFIYEDRELGGIWEWVSETAGGNLVKRDISIIKPDYAGNEVGRTNYSGVFPFSFELLPGTVFPGYHKYCVVMSYDAYTIEKNAAAAIDQMAQIEVSGIPGRLRVEIIEGPGIILKEVKEDEPYVVGLNQTTPIGFLYSGYQESHLEDWKESGAGRDLSIIIENLKGEEVFRWNFADWYVYSITEGIDERKEYMLKHTVGSGVSGFDRVPLLFPTGDSYNPDTDYLVEINGVRAGRYPAVKRVQGGVNLLLMVYDYCEGGDIFKWIHNSAGLDYEEAKTTMSVIQIENGVEKERTNYFGVVPLEYIHKYGFSQPEKVKEQVVLYYETSEIIK
ncbi:MAG: hypothetical protein K9N48_08550 [Verrucomicrobia bacterium]|nr:hypothetical protein [Verrucomicrobiota bacterium]MCF7707273.1 hypothetical protein [Verrucomicrobiota bacterium]